MNYINKLQKENLALQLEIELIEFEILQAIRYYNLDKFQGVNNDYAYVSTDVLPRLMKILNQVKSTK